MDGKPLLKEEEEGENKIEGEEGEGEFEEEEEEEENVIGDKEVIGDEDIIPDEDIINDEDIIDDEDGEEGTGIVTGFDNPDDETSEFIFDSNGINGNNGDNISHSYTYEELIEKAGFGWYHLYLLFVCGSGWFLDGLLLSLISFTVQLQKKDFDIGSIETGLLGSSIFIGMMFGAYFGGLISDKWGRKVIFVGGIFITSIFGLASSFSPDFLLFFCLRALSGLGLGATVPTDFSLFLEFVSKKRRGILLALLNIFFAVGTVTECLLAWAILPTIGWRWLTVISHLFGFIILIFRIFVPESPRYLFTIGRTEEAFKTIKRMNLVNFKKDIKGKLIIKKNQKKSKSIGVVDQFLLLFSPKYATTTLLLWVIWFMMSYGTYGFTFIIPSVFQSHLTSNPNLTYPSTLAVLGVGFLGYVLAVFLIGIVPRRLLLGITLCLSGVVCCCVGFYKNLWYTLVVSILLSISSGTPWATIYTYTPEVYPTIIRATGMGACSSLTRLGSTLTPLVGEQLMVTHYLLPFLTFGVGYLLAGISCFFLPYETKGKALKDTVQEEKDFDSQNIGEPLVDSSYQG